MRSVVLLGSTGSIGTQALDVVSRRADLRVTGLAAGANLELLVRQVVAHRVPVVAASREEAAPELEARLAASCREHGLPLPEILVGSDAATELAGRGADVVLNGITGSVGLRPTLAALRGGSTLALANKESLVIGGDLVLAARSRPDQIVPVDSEHSAIWQCLQAGGPVRRLVLTASGGPFRGWTADRLAGVTPQQALAHPTWSMGPVITVNSATLVNKGLELIEAHLLFGVGVDDVVVVVHPQSVVHSMVEFVDGSTLAQASPPDMRLPIAVALCWPDRLPDAAPACDWTAATAWTFEPLDEVTFPAVRLARSAAAAGTTFPAVYNAANEVAVARFLAGGLPFPRILATVEQVLAEHGGGELTLDSVLAADEWARDRARQVLSG